MPYYIFFRQDGFVANEAARGYLPSLGHIVVVLLQPLHQRGGLALNPDDPGHLSEQITRGN